MLLSPEEHAEFVKRKERKNRLSKGLPVDDNCEVISKATSRVTGDLPPGQR